MEIRRGEPVHATDGDIGRVQGLVVDPGNHYVTHVLLQEGHLRGRKEVAIPVSAVASTDDGIQLTITKQEVQDLPPVDIDHPDESTGGREDTDDRSGHRLGSRVRRAPARQAGLHGAAAGGLQPR